MWMQDICGVQEVIATCVLMNLMLMLNAQDLAIKISSGDINNYRLGFIKRYGEDKLSELDSIAHIERKFTKDELKEIIKKI